MIKKLRIQFIISNMILVFLTLAIIFSFLSLTTLNNIRQSSYRILDRENNVFSEPTYEKGDDDTFAPEWNKDGNKRQPINLKEIGSTAWIIIDEERNIDIVHEGMLSDISDDDLHDISHTVLDSNKTYGRLNKYNIRYKIFDSDEENTVRVGLIGLDYESSFFNQQLRSFTLICIGSLIFFFFISFYLSKLIVKPIDTAFTYQKQFVSDASHELKTPLTIILANTSMILKKKPAKPIDQYTQYIDTEAKRMRKLVEDLLLLTSLEEADSNIQFENVDFSNIVWQTTLAFEPVAYDIGKSIEQDITNDIYLYGHRENLERLIIILLDNACKYSDSKTKININLHKIKDKVILSVQNFGEIIAKDDAERLFDRFYRTDKSRHRAQQSYGLGLSMAKKIVKAHNGNISVQSTQQNGTIFTVVFSNKC